jgi:plastocyanin
MRLKALLVGCTVFAVVGCGGGSSGPRTPGRNTPPPPGGITVVNNAFSPSAKTVTVGTTLQWGWSTCSGGGGYGGGETCVAHNVTWVDGSPGSATQETGSYSRTFGAAGSYNYHCTVHQLEGMTGSVTVN